MRKFMMLCCIFCSVSAWGQHTIKGVVKDTKTLPVTGAAVIIQSSKDTLDYKGSTSGENGQFIINDIESGKYNLTVSLIGYMDYQQELVLEKSTDVGEIILKENITQLNEVIVTAGMVKRFADKKEYKLTNIEKEQYSSALTALEHLPKIQ